MPFSRGHPMSQEAPVAPPRRRPRRWRRRIFVAALCLTFLVGGGIVLLVWLSSSALHELMAEMDRDDPGWRLEELEAKRAVLPDERNSALQILAVKRLQGGQSVLTNDNYMLFDDLPQQIQLNNQQAV